MSDQDSQVCAGQRVLGDIAGDGNLVILGRLEGAIHIGGALTVGSDALVLADIVAASVCIEGRVEGRVRAAGEVTIGHRGVLIGNVEGLLHVEEGGIFQGRLLRDQTTDSTGEALKAVPPGEPEAVTPPVQPYEAEELSEDPATGDTSAIRRLTADDTFPPLPSFPTTDNRRKNRKVKAADEVTRDGRKAGVRTSELPDTRKQKVRRDTKPNRIPSAQVRAPRKPGNPDLGDAWFEDEDYLLDSK